MKFEKPIYITSPLVPNEEDFLPKISELMHTKLLTNHGAYHNELESKLATMLKVQSVSLFNNGTIGLLVALKALNINDGEVITTAFTFAATPHSISWQGLKPVFCDIKEDTFVIDEDKIEALITPKTKAIMAVHVYGFACNVDKIDKIAKKYNLKVIYDAAHAFLTEIDGKGIASWGDITMFSFHATKLFNTIEGGCLAYNNTELKQKIYLLRNFGIANEDEVVEIGINGKMNEVQALWGLQVLEKTELERNKRTIVYDKYKELLTNVNGIVFPEMPTNTANSYQYMPIRVLNNKRDYLYKQLKEYNIFSRKYFYPACTDYKPYIDYVKQEDFPVVNKIKHEMLCLPFYGDLQLLDVENICEIIIYLLKNDNN